MSVYKLSKWRLKMRKRDADCTRLTERLEAYRDIEPSGKVSLIVDEQAELGEPDTDHIPEVDFRSLDINVLRDAIENPGCLIVRNMFDPKALAGMDGIIDEVLDACDNPVHVRRRQHTHYRNPPENVASLMPGGKLELAGLRQFSTAGGSALAVESPCVAEMLLEFYESNGIKDLVTQYLGEDPCLSAKKWVLRRSELPVGNAGWHQDGNFMGTSINTINLWIPLTKCGGKTGSPGMEVVPARLNKLATSEGADFDWSVSDEVARNSFGKAKPVSPEFNVGDAFFFDHFNLHRTQPEPGIDYTTVRYAIETWFFGSSTFPKSQVPIAW